MSLPSSSPEFLPSPPSQRSGRPIGSPQLLLVLSMTFVIALSILGHDPHLAVTEALALLAGINALRG